MGRVLNFSNHAIKCKTVWLREHKIVEDGPGRRLLPPVPGWECSIVQVWSRSYLQSGDFFQSALSIYQWRLALFLARDVPAQRVLFDSWPRDLQMHVQVVLRYGEVLDGCHLGSHQTGRRGKRGRRCLLGASGGRMIKLFSNADQIFVVLTSFLDSFQILINSILNYAGQ